MYPLYGKDRTRLSYREDVGFDLAVCNSVGRRAMVKKLDWGSFRFRRGRLMNGRSDVSLRLRES